MSKASSDKLLVVGRITGVFGVKGWVKVYSYMTPMEAICDHPDWYIEAPSGWQPLDVEQRKWQGGKLIAQVRGTYDRDEAKVFCNRDIAIAKAELPALAHGDYYWHQLEGLNVYCTTDGGEPILLGQVARMLETGANDVLVVKACDGSIDKRERLIPYLPDRVVRAVDLANGALTLDWDPEY